MHSKTLISILIPLYNWDATALLNELEEQAQSLSDRCFTEIIVVDDGSTENYNIDTLVDRMPKVSFRRLAKNKGRSGARNELLQLAKGDYVLFLDADMLPDKSTYLQSYLEHIKAGRDIVCGGISYEHIDADDTLHSFYLYKSARTESLPAARRNRSPWKYFFTSNILMRRNIAVSIPFHQAFRGYGFEDIEWGIRLSKHYSIHHIDNTCTHTGVMTKEETFEKMRQSIKNFAMLLNLHPQETRGSVAAKISSLLAKMPSRLLTFSDKTLITLFYRTGWNPLLFAFFQADKMILLAQERKRKAS